MIIDPWVHPPTPHIFASSQNRQVNRSIAADFYFYISIVLEEFWQQCKMNLAINTVILPE